MKEIKDSMSVFGRLGISHIPNVIHKANIADL